MRRSTVWPLVLIPLALACGDDSSPSGTGAILVVTPTQLELEDCATALLGAAVVDGAGNPVPGAEIGYASTDPGVVTVTDAGVVTATGAGATTIMVTSGSLTKSVPVEVTAADLLALTLSAGPFYPEAQATATAQLTDCRGEPQGGAAASFASLDPGVATVSGDDVTAVTFGTARIVATLGLLSDTATMSVIGHPAGAGVESITTSLSPFGVAARTDGLVYVTQLAGGVVSFDADAEVKLDSIAVGSVPTDVAFVRDGSLAWVADQLDNAIGIVDVAAKALVRTLPVTGAPFRVLASADGSRAYVTGNADSVFAFDTEGEVLAAAEAGPTDGNGLALSPDGATLAVGGMGGGLAVLQAATLVHSHSDVVATIGQEVQFAPDGTRLFFADEGGTVHVLDPGTFAVAGAELTVPGAFDLALTPDGKELWVSSPSNGKVHVYDAVTGAGIRTLTLGGTPRRIAFALHGRVAVIANEGGAVHFVR